MGMRVLQVGLARPCCPTLFPHFIPFPQAVHSAMRIHSLQHAPVLGGIGEAGGATHSGGFQGFQGVCGWVGGCQHDTPTSTQAASQVPASQVSVTCGGWVVPACTTASHPKPGHIWGVQASKQARPKGKAKMQTHKTNTKTNKQRQACKTSQPIQSRHASQASKQGVICQAAMQSWTSWQGACNEMC